MKRLLFALALLSSACGTDTIIAVSGSRQISPPATGGAASVPPTDAPDVPPAPGQFHTEGSRIVDTNGNTVRIRAVSWHGFEMGAAVVQGLWARPLDDILANIEQHGFNTLRLPFSSELLATSGPNPQPQPHTNPDLVGLNRLQTFTEVIDRAGEHGLKVILVHQASVAGDQQELWHTPEYPDSRFVDVWRSVALLTLQKPHVVAFELHCDLRGPATWGEGTADTDWRAAAERAGNTILETNPNLLIIVNGIQTAAGTSYVRGGNLSAARDAPISLKRRGQLVYGAADYPYDALEAKDGVPAGGYPWLIDPEFPANLPSVWDARWGYLVRENIAPVVLTSFGSRYETSTDKRWLDAIVPYVKGLEIGFAYSSLNPDTVGTGGLLDAEYATLNREKYEALAPLLR